MKLTICAFIDAYGWELFQRHRLLDGELQQANPLQTVLGYSSACDPTILTGLQPEEHGHFSFFYYRPTGSPLSNLRALRFLPQRLSRSGRIRNVISRAAARALGYTGYFQLYQVPFKHLDVLAYSETRDLYMGGGINSGARTFLDEFKDQGVPFHISDWRRSEEHNLQELHKQIRLGEVRFAYLYMAQMDGILHHRGTKDQAVADKIKWYDQELRALLDQARANYDEVDLHLFSDHGMTDVKETCNLTDLIEKTGLQFGTDYVAVYDSTMARFWFLNSKAQSLIEKALQKERRGGWLSQSKLKEWGCNFKDNFYGDAFFLMKPGILLCPSFMGYKPVAGMHGYAPDDKDSVALFASTKKMNIAPQKLSDLSKFILEEVA